MIVVICDVCDQLVLGGWTLYSVGRGDIPERVPTSAPPAPDHERRFVVGDECQDRPFRVPDPRHYTVVISPAIAPAVLVTRAA